MRFPSRSDYFQFIENELGADAQEILHKDPMLVRELQRHWHSRVAQGCVFAAFLNSSRLKREEDAAGWFRYVEPGALSVRERSAWRPLRAAAKYAIETPEIEGFSALFPRIDGTRDFAELIYGLGEHLGWSIETKPSSSSLLQVLATVEISPGVDSIALLFGSFEFMPPTRLAPFVEVAFRPKGKPAKLYRRLTPNVEEAHLADQPLWDYLEEPQMDVFWNRTQLKHRQFEEGASLKANAHLSAYVPIEAWKRLTAQVD